MHLCCGVEVTELSTNKSHHLSPTENISFHLMEMFFLCFPVIPLLATYSNVSGLSQAYRWYCVTCKQPGLLRSSAEFI